MSWYNIKWNVPLDEAFGLKKIKWFDKRYESAMGFSFVYQFFLLFMAGMILDGGQCAQFTFVAIVAFWTSVIVLILRRPWNPSKIDILYIKWGFFPILLSTPFIMGYIWHIRGV